MSGHPPHLRYFPIFRWSTTYLCGPSASKSLLLSMPGQPPRPSPDIPITTFENFGSSEAPKVAAPDRMPWSWHMSQIGGPVVPTHGHYAMEGLFSSIRNMFIHRNYFTTFLNRYRVGHNVTMGIEWGIDPRGCRSSTPWAEGAQVTWKLWSATMFNPLSSGS